MTSELQPPWNIIALINKSNFLFDPRVMEALEEALGLKTEDVAAAVDAYLATTPFVAALNGMSAVWKGTQSEYDDLSIKDPNTLYVIE